MLHSLMRHEIAAVGTQQLNSIYIQRVIVITVWTSGWKVLSTLITTSLTVNKKDHY